MLLTASLSKNALLSKTKGQVNYLFLKLPHILVLLLSLKIVCYFPANEKAHKMPSTHQKVNKKVEHYTADDDDIQVTGKMFR